MYVSLIATEREWNSNGIQTYLSFSPIEVATLGDDPSKV